jgi:hypothetical protein
MFYSRRMAAFCNSPSLVKPRLPKRFFLRQRCRRRATPRQQRSERLMRVVQALDGWQAEVSHRDIGIALYGDTRVERDWMHPGDNLRDQVRRAIRYGRDLMADGYKRFLN